MKLRRYLSFLLTALLLLGCCPMLPAAAAEEPVPVSSPPEYDGYLVQVNGELPASLLGEAQYLGFGVYCVRSEESLGRLASSGLAEYIGPNRRVEPAVTLTDPYYRRGDQWYLTGSNGIDIEAAWDWQDDVITSGGLTGSGVTVAVLDTGLYGAHNDLSGTRIVSPYNATTDGGTYYDVSWHGTAVSGVIAATANNGYMIAGAAHDVDLMPVRVFDSDGYGYYSYVITGLQYAVQKHADVINLSLGAPDKDVMLGKAIKAALDSGSIVVAAVGNESSTVLNYPAAYDGVIGVGAIDSAGVVAGYSQRNSSVWVSAPGSGIVTLHSSTKDSYVTTDGTSFASPCVAALAALARQYANAHGQSLTPARFAELLRLTARDRGAAGYDYNYGYGTVSASAILNGMTERTVTYELDGGSWPAAAPVTSYVPYYGEAVELTAVLPEKEDYFFAGWYDNAECTGEKVSSFVPSDSLEARRYYAKWVRNVTDLASVTLSGYAAEKQQDGSWTAYLPAGTAFPTGTDCVSAAFDYSGNDVALAYTVSHTGSGVWTINVTQDSVYRDQYLLRADNTTYHAPALAAGQSASVSGSAAPASLDGETPLRGYSADLTRWFTDADAGDTVSYALSGLKVDGAAAETVVGLALSEEGALAYAPPAAAAGTRLTFTVTASDSRFTGSSVNVTLQVDALPVSAPVLSASSGSYDALAPEALTVGFTSYDNTLSALSVGDTALAEGTDYTVYRGQEVVGDAEEKSDPMPATVTLTTAFLSTLDNGDTTVTFRFATGRSTPAEKTAAYTVAVSNSCVGGHTGDGGVVTKSPTCTETGVRTTTCTVCNTVVSQETIPASGHTGDGGVVTKSPTCTETGTRTTTCTVCNAVVSQETIPASGHTGDGGVVTKSPTCTETGVRTTTCTVCNEVVSREAIPAAGHSYSGGKCTVCGAADPNAGGGSSGGGSSGGSSAEQPGENEDPNPPQPGTETVTQEDGTVVTTTLRADGGKTVETLTPENDLRIVVTDPAGAVEASLALPADPGKGKTFADVEESIWYGAAVSRVTAYGLFSGTGPSAFSPAVPMNRGMLMRVLYNFSGKPEYGTEGGVFTDVREGVWYTDAVGWGYTVGITAGISHSSFSPEQEITREQLVTMLYRYAKLIGKASEKRADLSAFPDREEIGRYAEEAVSWAVAEGLLRGRPVNGVSCIAPRGAASRAEVAVVLDRFVSCLKQ